MMASILKALNIDFSLIYQFGIVVAFYFIVKSLLLDKLLMVIQYREEKTSKLEQEANKNFHKAEDLAQQYKREMDAAFNEYQEVVSKKKADLSSASQEKIKAAEKEANAKVESKRKELVEELEGKRKDLLSNSEGLSQNLVEKLIQ